MLRECRVVSVGSGVGVGWGWGLDWVRMRASVRVWRAESESMASISHVGARMGRGALVSVHLWTQRSAGCLSRRGEHTVDRTGCIHW